MLALALRRLPPDVPGIYGPGKNVMPRRALLLYPRAADAFLAALSASGGVLRVSDVFRSAESSLEALQSGRGAQPPGYSAHNYGLAIDIAIERTLADMRLDYGGLLDFLSDHGWHCYRRDRSRGREEWHFNYLGDLASSVLPGLGRDQWAQAAEAAIQEAYGPALHLDAGGIQTCLARLKLYRGELDGDLGPLSRQAAAAFGRAWNVQADFDSPRFQRTLAFVAAQYQIEESTQPALVA